MWWQVWNKQYVKTSDIDLAYAILIGVLRELQYKNKNKGGDVGPRIQDTITFEQSKHNARTAQKRTTLKFYMEIDVDKNPNML